MATKTNKSSLVEEPEEETGEEYPLVYNAIFNNCTITFNFAEGSAFQTGKPGDPGKPPGT